MVASNSKSRVSLTQRKNFHMELCVVVRLVLHGLDFTDKFLSVVVHDVTLASAVGPTAAYAAKRAAVYALDAIEGDAEFITRTCDCRAKTQAKKAHKKALKQMLASLQEQNDDHEAVEQALTLLDGDEDGAIVEASGSGDPQVSNT